MAGWLSGIRRSRMDPNMSDGDWCWGKRRQHDCSIAGIQGWGLWLYQYPCITAALSWADLVSDRATANPASNICIYTSHLSGTRPPWLQFNLLYFVICLQKKTYVRVFYQNKLVKKNLFVRVLIIQFSDEGSVLFPNQGRKLDWMAAVPINFSRYFTVQPPAGTGRCGGGKIMVLSGVLSACLSPSRRLADGKNYPDQYSVELETKVHEVFSIMEKALTGAIPKGM